MLKGVDPLLGGELLKVLDDMGHGDRLLVVDRNYPAHSTGRPVIRLGDASVTRALTAILSVFPLDSFVQHPLQRMEVDDDAANVTETQQAVIDLAQRVEGRPLEYGVIPRLEFYQRAREAFAVVHTLETAPYSCFVLQKGVVFLD